MYFTLVGLEPISHVPSGQKRFITIHIKNFIKVQSVIQSVEEIANAKLTHGISIRAYHTYFAFHLFHE